MTYFLGLLAFYIVYIFGSDVLLYITFLFRVMVMVMVRRDLMEVGMIKIWLKPWKETFCRKIQMFTGMQFMNSIKLIGITKPFSSIVKTFVISLHNLYTMVYCSRNTSGFCSSHFMIKKTE